MKMRGQDRVRHRRGPRDRACRVPRAAARAAPRASSSRISTATLAQATAAELGGLGLQCDVVGRGRRAGGGGGSDRALRSRRHAAVERGVRRRPNSTSTTRWPSPTVLWAPHVAGARDGARVCVARGAAGHARARRGLPRQRGFGGGPAVPGRRCGLQRDQACGGRASPSRWRSPMASAASTCRSCARNTSPRRSPASTKRCRRMRLPGCLSVEQAATAIADGLERGHVPDPDPPGSADASSSARRRTTTAGSAACGGSGPDCGTAQGS